MPTWTTPKTWNTGEQVTATDLNTHLRDNLDALKAPPTDTAVLNESANYTTTSTTFVDIDASTLSLTITTTGGDVLIGFVGTVYNASNYIFFDVTLDGTRMAGDDGMTEIFAANYSSIAFTYLKTGVSAGSHTFKLQWKTASGTATLFAGAGTASADTHPLFWAREVS